MDKLTQYRQLVQEMLHDYSEQKPAYGNIEVETIFDTVRDYYQIVHVGWEGQNWVHTCIIHIDIKNNCFKRTKIYRKHNIFYGESC